MVCKTWRDTVNQPSPLWHHVHLSLNQAHSVLRSACQAYFRRRRNHLQSLHLTLPHDQTAVVPDILEALDNEPPLERLSIDFGGGLVDEIPTFIPQLCWLRNLRDLRISHLGVSCISCLSLWEPCQEAMPRDNEENDQCKHLTPCCSSIRHIRCSLISFLRPCEPEQLQESPYNACVQ